MSGSQGSLEGLVFSRLEHTRGRALNNLYGKTICKVGNNMSKAHARGRFEDPKVWSPLFTICVSLAIALICASSPLCLMSEALAQADDGFKTLDCPPETKNGPPQNCQDVRRMAYALATKKNGYADTDRNGVPDVMQRPYVVNQNDCSTGNAHAACMFNDACTAEYGQLLGLRSNSACHATVMFEGKDGRKFECDFTPQSSGIFIMNNRDTQVGPAFPDAGESMDPAYREAGCPMNGANTSALNPFGGGGGGMTDTMLQLLLMKLLLDMLNQQQVPTALPSASPAPTIAPPINTPTPTATITPTAMTTVTARATPNTRVVNLDALVLPTAAPVAKEFSPPKGQDFGMVGWDADVLKRADPALDHSSSNPNRISLTRIVGMSVVYRKARSTL